VRTHFLGPQLPFSALPKKKGKKKEKNEKMKKNEKEKEKTTLR
jgi:hypothetical protein